MEAAGTLVPGVAPAIAPALAPAPALAVQQSASAVPSRPRPSDCDMRGAVLVDDEGGNEWPAGAGAAGVDDEHMRASLRWRWWVWLSAVAGTDEGSISNALPAHVVAVQEWSVGKKCTQSGSYCWEM